MQNPMIPNNQFNTNDAYMSQLMRQYENDLAKMNAIRQQQQQARPSSILDDIRAEVEGMTNDDKIALNDYPDYIQAYAIYNASFMDFLGHKFGAEFTENEGKAAAENILNVIRSVKQRMQQVNKEKKDKLDAMLRLIDNDPIVRQRYQEAVMGISPQVEEEKKTTRKTK